MCLFYLLLGGLILVLVSHFNLSVLFLIESGFSVIVLKSVDTMVFQSTYNQRLSLHVECRNVRAVQTLLVHPCWPCARSAWGGDPSDTIRAFAVTCQALLRPSVRG